MTCICGIENCKFQEVSCNRQGHYDFSIYSTQKYDNEELRKILSSHKIIFTPANFKIKFNEIFHIFMAGIRLINVDLSHGSKENRLLMVKKVNEAIEKFDEVYEFNEKITKICTIRGRTLRIGRMRNDSCWQLEAGELIVLTCDEAYRNCSLNEICYVSNFKRVLPMLQICDKILSKTFELRVVKIVGKFVTCFIEQSGVVYSYQKLYLPQFDELYHQILEVEVEDCEFAIENNFDFIIAPDVRHAKYYHQLRILTKGSRIKFIAKIERNLNENVIGKIVEHFYGVYLTFNSDQALSESKKFNKLIFTDFPKENLKDVDGFILKCNGLDELLCKIQAINNYTRSDNVLQKHPGDLIKNNQIKAIVCITNSGRALKCTKRFNEFNFIITLTKDKNLAKRLNLRKNMIPMVYVGCGQSIDTQNIEMMKIALKFGKFMKMFVSEDPVIERVNKI